MGRLQHIEQKLTAIDSAAFQNLCDTFLVLRSSNELASINRTGSQLGKQKTVKGTPDSFYRLSNGHLYFVEFTTKADDLVTKIKEDIDKCLDEDKTGVRKEDIKEIIICTNSRLTTVDETKITGHAVSKNVRIELIGIDTLATQILTRYLILAKEFLDIKLDTGQLLPLEKFIEEYSNKGGQLSTPLSNEFRHREGERKDLKLLLAECDVVLLSGFPGVGKTKLALQGIQEFQASNPSWTAMAVSQKDMDISEDLRIHLDQEGNYILLVDDANRQLVNLKQILGVFRETRKGHIKLLLTVRDYALDDIKKELLEVQTGEQIVPKFTDDEIKQIICAEPFDIKNPKYQERIISLADGNARLAIMAAKIAKEKQAEFLLGGVFELYDLYFQTFIRDNSLFGNTDMLKTLGIVSFFYTIDMKDRAFVDRILEVFQLDYYNFNEAIVALESRELVQVQYDNVRISEQVMGTYFFYKVFIHDELLSFGTLLTTFFPDWQKRFADTIIPANNAFGYENVVAKINPALDNFMKVNMENDEAMAKFISTFWYYKPDETLAYFFGKIKAMHADPEEINSNSTSSDSPWSHDDIIDSVANFFDHMTDHLVPAVELAFSYVAKRPSLERHLLKKLREKLIPDIDDHDYDYVRQEMVMKLIINKAQIEGREEYQAAFFAMSKLLLSHKFQSTRAGRGHSVIMQNFSPPIERMGVLRGLVWDFLFKSFAKSPEEVLEVIANYVPNSHECSVESLEFDLPRLLPFLSSALDENNFYHIYTVRTLTENLVHLGYRSETCISLDRQFDSEEYRWYLKLDWNTHRGKREYEFDDYDHFRRLKTEDLRQTFLLCSQADASAFKTCMEKIIQLKDDKFFSIQESLNIILAENFVRSNSFGYDMFLDALEYYPQNMNALTMPIAEICRASREWPMKLWQRLKLMHGSNAHLWQLAFFNYLPDSYANKYFKRELLRTLYELTSSYKVYVDPYRKFDNVPPSNKLEALLSKFELFRDRLFINRPLIPQILEIAYAKNQSKTAQISFDMDFFEKYVGDPSIPIALLKKSYIQQELIAADYFDFKKKGLKKLVALDNKFVMEYLDEILKVNNGRRRTELRDSLSFLWDMEDNNKTIEEVANLIIEKKMYAGIGEHPLTPLFTHLTPQRLELAQNFILTYIGKYNTDAIKMDAIFAVIRKRMSSLFDDALLEYLKHNAEMETFKRVSWRGNGGTYSGDVNIGDIEAKDWQRIMDTVSRAENQLQLIPIKSYLKQQIQDGLNRAEYERKRKFTNPNF